MIPNKQICLAYLFACDTWGVVFEQSMKLWLASASVPSGLIQLKLTKMQHPQFVRKHNFGGKV